MACIACWASTGQPDRTACPALAPLGKWREHQPDHFYLSAPMASHTAGQSSGPHAPVRQALWPNNVQPPQASIPMSADARFANHGNIFFRDSRVRLPL